MYFASALASFHGSLATLEIPPFKDMAVFRPFYCAE